MSRNVKIRGAGGGKSGGQQRAPLEAPDTLRSLSYARVLDLLSEGEVFGPADPDHPLRCIYYNETPVENADGSLNFKNIQIEVRNGTQTQDYIKGFETTENEIAVSVELTDSTPWTHSITNHDLDAIRLRMSVLALSEVKTDTGDIKGYFVGYAIDMNVDSGGYTTVFQGQMTGKSSSKYERTHRIELPPFTTNIVIRLRRTTANSSKSNIQDTSVVEAFAELVDAKLRYPMSALCGHVVAAEQFNAIPTRAYHWKGRIVKVPINYDPITRAYTGVWNGTFKTAYTNNPAWIWYDMLIATRYGLGDRVDAALVDKWTLYAIGQYCDALVPDGFGGTEPRFTCNTFLQTREDATKVMQDLATVFRGMMYAAGGTLVAACDMPTDVSYTYAPANVIENKFNYMGSSQKARHTVALVSWNDMSNFGRTTVEYVEDEEGIARFGIRQVEINAIGCTSRGQARRLGKYVLLTERYATDTVNFDVGLDGNIPQPGGVIAIADPLRAGKRMGGRLKAATTTVLTPDAMPDALAAGDSITVILPTGLPEKRVISAVDATTITVPALSAAPGYMSMFLCESATVNAQTFRVLAITEKTPTRYSVTGLQYVAGIYDAVELGLQIDEPPIGSAGQIPAAPTGLVLSQSMRFGHNIAFNVLNADWGNDPYASRYIVQWRKDGGAWTAPQKVTDSNFDFENPFAGTYICRVWGENYQGIPGPSAESDPITIEDAKMPVIALDIDENGIVTVDCRYTLFTLELTRNVNGWEFINVAPQDSCIVKVKMAGLGNHSCDMPNNVSTVSGKPYVPTPILGVEDMLGFATMDGGTSWRLQVSQAGADVEPIVVNITPKPATGSVTTDGTTGSAPTANAFASFSGTDPGIYAAVSWQCVDGGGVDPFLVDSNIAQNINFTIPSGTTGFNITQTWRCTVEQLGRTGSDTVQVQLVRSVLASGGGGGGGGGGGTGGAPLSVASSDGYTLYDVCQSGPNVGCVPVASARVAFTNLVGTPTFTFTRTDGGTDTAFSTVAFYDSASATWYVEWQAGRGKAAMDRTQTWTVGVYDAGTGQSASFPSAFTVNLAREYDSGTAL